MSRRGRGTRAFDFSEKNYAVRQAGGQIVVPESEVLSSTMTLLALHPSVAWARRFNTGAAKIPTGKKEGDYRYVKFAFTGCSDILGMLFPRPRERVGAFLAIETKTIIGIVTDDQQAFLDTVRAAGGCAGVARSAQNAKDLIEAFMLL